MGAAAPGRCRGLRERACFARLLGALHSPRPTPYAWESTFPPWDLLSPQSPTHSNPPRLCGLFALGSGSCAAPRAPVPLSRGNPAGAAARLQAAVLPPAWRGRRKPAGFPKRRAAAGCALGAGRARGAGRAAGEPWSAAGRAGSPETLFGEKFSLRSFPPSPVLAHTPPARRASTSSLGLWARDWRARTPSFPARLGH